MKHSIKTALALLIVFSATFAKSADLKAANCKVVAGEEEKHYRVVYQAPEKSKVTIKLYDNKHQVIYTESQQSVSGFMKKFDLSNLPDGTYQLVVKADNYRFQEEITLESASGFNAIFSPQSNRKIAFMAQNESGRSLSLYILDQQGDVVYRELFEEASGIHKMYNFKKLKSDQVTFVLYHEDQLIKEQEIRF